MATLFEASSLKDITLYNVLDKSFTFVRNNHGETLLLIAYIIGISLALCNQSDVFSVQPINPCPIKQTKKSKGITINITQIIHSLIHFRTTFRSLVKKIELVKDALEIKKIARSLSHSTTLFGKKALKLKIDKNETEIKSYLDVKRHMAEQWPFMATVANVRSKDKVLCNGYECRVFSSYAYLDFVRNERVQNAAVEAAKIYASGNHGPRMLGGNTLILRELEQSFAKWLGREDSLLCSAGYLACLSAIVGLARESDVIFSDNRNHASLRAGMKLSNAKIIYFKHNDFNHCEKLIKENIKKYKNAFMIIESVYSMDGDIGHLPSARKLCDKYNMTLIMDEAHGLGALGKTGKGAEEHFNMPMAADVIVGTFSKSFSSVGGFIVAKKDYIDFLDFHTPGNVFSAPMSAYHAAAALESLKVIQEQPELIRKLHYNQKTLRYLLTNAKWPNNYPNEYKYELEGDEDTCVIPVIFPDDSIRVLKIATIMRQKGFYIAAVCAPACPLRRPRFRITATSAYSDEDMNDFVNTFVQTIVDTPRFVPEGLQ